MEELIKKLDTLEQVMNDVSDQMQKLRQDLGRASYENAMLSVRESYEHPWYKYKREELIASGNYTEPTGKETTNS